MPKHIFALIVGITILVSGCAIRTPTAFHDAATTPQERKDGLDKDYQNALSDCTSQMNSIRTQFQDSGYTELSIASVGILAGSVVVPALAAKAVAAKSAIAGWGGVSGAANAGQYTLQQKGASASTQAAVYETMRQEIKKASTEFGTAKTDVEKIAAVNALAITCRFPPLPAVEAPKPPSSTTSPNGASPDV